MSMLSKYRFNIQIISAESKPIHNINFQCFYSPTGCEMKAHERDIWTPAPTILKPPAPRDRVSMDDVTDFPE